MEKAEVQLHFISIWVGFFGKTYLLPLSQEQIILDSEVITEPSDRKALALMVEAQP